MIKIIKYEVGENDINVGFKKYNFVVYGSIGKELVEGLTKKKILQKVYEICKESIDYELDRYNKGLSNSIIYEETEEDNFEEFIPEESKVVDVVFEIEQSDLTLTEPLSIELEAVLKNQYNEIINYNVNFSSSEGHIEGNVLTLEPVEEYTEIEVTAYYNNIKNVKIIRLCPYEATQPTNEIDVLNNRIAKLEEVIDTLIGGEDIE